MGPKCNIIYLSRQELKDNNRQPRSQCRENIEKRVIINYQYSVSHAIIIIDNATI